MKVMVIGSGPIVIGQAAEFDYAGTQACKSLKEEGCQVVLINSNPATIMTDPGVSDALYIEPLNVDFCERVIARERPEALLPTLGGQTGLNLAIQLADAGILDEYNVRLLGTPLSAIRKAEDREEFRTLMREIKEPVPESFIVENEDQLKAILPVEIPDENGRLMEFPYPRIVRPAYTLGGTGGGVANTPEELWEIGRKGLKLSMRSQLMIERSLLGWKEIEYEVMRDSAGNCITVCNMENFDPMGVHTGDSIVVAPSQTLSDLEYHMMRTAALKIINSLGIEGGCNVQMALNPDSFDYYIIEVNPRVSRSSALASKATGYPIARVAAKIAIGKTLDQIDNEVTGVTKACFEPALDYCVVKIPRWPFDKFTTGDRTLFTQMKATGEVMAIDRTFEAALMKAVRGLEVKQKDLWHEKFAGSRRGDTGFQPVRGSSNSKLDFDLPIQSNDHVVALRNELQNPIEVALHSMIPVHETFAIEMEPSALRACAISDPSVFRKDMATLQLLRSGSDAISLAKDRELDPIAVTLFQQKLLKGYSGSINELYLEWLFDKLNGSGLEWNSLLDRIGVSTTWLEDSVRADAWYRGLNKGPNRDIFDVYTIEELATENPFEHSQPKVEEIFFKAQQILLDMLKDPLREFEKEFGGNVYGFFYVTRTLLTAQPRFLSSNTSEQAQVTNIPPMSDSDLQAAVKQPTDERLWAIAEGLRRGWSIEEVNRLCRVDPWFLAKMKNIIEQESQTLIKAESKVVYKMVDTCAAEFESNTPYYYATSEIEDDAVHA